MLVRPPTSLSLVFFICEMEVLLLLCGLREAPAHGWPSVASALLLVPSAPLYLSGTSGRWMVIAMSLSSSHSKVGSCYTGPFFPQLLPGHKPCYYVCVTEGGHNAVVTGVQHLMFLCALRPRDPLSPQLHPHNMSECGWQRLHKRSWSGGGTPVPRCGQPLCPPGVLTPRGWQSAALSWNVLYTC